ncbi:MAG: mechanosensitive ion channel family protein [Akkermansiaceae bacterium]|nr:mechanosensitive ion channel family protein [Akkermansiaceae bacterium]NNM28981.1 mechanosensitive ion channel family protein [Akkermansiaceae bacterium]
MNWLAESSPDNISDFANVWTILIQSLHDIYKAFVERLPFFASALLFLVVWFLLIRLVVRVLGPKVLRRSKLRQSLQLLLVRLVSVAGWVIGLAVAAIIVFPGLSVAKALGAAGLASVAIGLAFKDIFQNFFAGIMLLWKFPFEPGDFIECGDLRGRVQDTQLRLTTIRQPDGQLLVVPNSHLLMNPVQIVTSKPKRRVSLMTGVGYGEDVTKAVKVISRALEKCKRIDHDQEVHVVPAGFGSSSIDIEILFWTGSSPMDVRQATGEAVTKVKAALDEAGIEIPFPYRTLTFAEPLKVAGGADQVLQAT